MICMSERSSVTIAEILGENYKITSIECSDYNPSIDSTITVTISVNDVYGDAISNESVTVTASEGNFTQLNGSSITAAATVTATTNIDGQFTLTYTCSEWGLATFSANNSNIQIKVTGVKTIIITSNITLYVNGDSRTCTMRIIGLSGSVSSADTPKVVYTIPSAYAQYLPKTTLIQQDYNRNRIDLLGSDGTISMMQNAAGSGSLNVTFTYNY